MKITGWLISLIILVVSFTPCKDAYGNQSITSPVISVDTHSDNQHSNVIDSCSPFCACACCSSPTALKHQTVHQNIAIILKREYTDFYSGNVASALIVVWQPPKLFS